MGTSNRGAGPRPVPDLPTLGFGHLSFVDDWRWSFVSSHVLLPQSIDEAIQDPESTHPTILQFFLLITTSEGQVAGMACVRAMPRVLLLPESPTLDHALDCPSFGSGGKAL